jgi:hypothetical protein
MEKMGVTSVAELVRLVDQACGKGELFPLAAKGSRLPQDLA